MADKTLIIAIDFDGTIVTHAYPEIGQPVPGALETMKEFIARGDKLILWTMRSGDKLHEAVKYCQDNGVRFWGINENPEQHLWTTSPKVFAHVYIDDRNVNGPTLGACVDWFVVRHCLIAPSF